MSTRRLKFSLCAWTALCGAAAGLAAPAEVTAAEQSGLEEIVVTAQRRSERLQDVPATVTSVSGDRLSNAGVGNVGNLSQLVPAFRVDYTAGFAQPSIRGVSTALSGLGGGSNVGVYVDGFYNPSPQTTDFSFLSVNNIQVLKGPQGTLFGRNTTAGAVLITTSEPQKTPTLRARASYGNYNTVDTALYGSIGAGRLAFDLAAMYRHSDGFIENIVNGDDEVGESRSATIRVGMKADVADDSYLLARYQYSSVSDPTVVLWNAYPGPGGFETIANVPGNIASIPVPGTVFGRKRGEVALIPGFQPQFYTELHTGQLTGKFDLGFADLTTYSQIRVEEATTDIQFANIPLDLLHVRFLRTEHVHTQEALLSSKPGGRWDWVAGFFYFNQLSENPFWAAPTFLPNVLYTTHLDIHSYAAFADVTYRLFDQLYVTGGLRYSFERNTAAFWDCTASGAGVGFCPPPSGQPSGVTKLKDQSWYNLSPRAVLRYKFDDDSSVYVSYSKGFKAGFLDASSFNPVPIAPEKITSYEVGYKMARGGTQLSASAFYYDYKNLQVQFYQNAAATTTNAASSEVYGAELSLAQRITDKLTISGGLAYTHARYDKYPGAPAGAFSFASGLILNTPAIDASGNRLTRAPSWSGNISADYVTPLAGGELALNANVYYSTKFYFDPSNLHGQDAYALVNMRAGWTEPSGRWTFSLWGNNVTDEEYITQVLSGTYESETTWGMPATYGVTVEFKY